MQIQYPGRHNAAEVNQGIFDNDSLNLIDGLKLQQIETENLDLSLVKQNSNIHSAEILLKHYWGHNFESDSLY